MNIKDHKAAAAAATITTKRMTIFDVILFSKTIIGHISFYA